MMTHAGGPLTGDLFFAKSACCLAAANREESHHRGLCGLRRAPSVISVRLQRVRQGSHSLVTQKDPPAQDISPGVYACSYENDSAERSRASVLREHEPPLAVVRVSSLTVFSSEAR